MPDSALQIYYNQAINFLQSTTIKYSPIANAYNTAIQANGGIVDLTDETTWKYYINLIGEYHSTDIMMQIVSLDTRLTMNFTKANLAISPKTAAAYIIGTPQYNALCTNYPSQTDLIKSIVYPVPDINNAILAPDFTILAFGLGFLESQEQSVIVDDIQAYINYATERWYQNFLAYEDYFYWAFWGVLWQNLFGAIMASRMKYTKTAYANSFHIWQYLISHNIGDYRDVLTNAQAAFLYRNLGYLLANKGKQSNLIILANNLLSNIGVGLVGKTIFHTLVGSQDTCQWVPEIISEPIQTSLASAVTVIPAQSITDITFELVKNGLDISTTADYISVQTAKMANTPVNVLTTKLLEIQKLGLDTKYAQILNNFIVDTLVSTINAGLYVPLVAFIDSITGTNIVLNGKEALVMYYYCIYKSLGLTPVNLPNIYTPSCAYRLNINTANIPKSFEFRGVNYNLSQFFDVNAVLSQIIYPTIPITSGNDFSNLIGNLFTTLVASIRFCRASADLLTIKAIHVFYNAILQNTTYQLSLESTELTYPIWLVDITHDYANMFSAYDSSVNAKVNYTNLAQSIMSQLIPLTNTTVLHYVDNSDAISKLYTRIKDLFVTLCSYNVTFLDTQNAPSIWMLSDIMAASPVGNSSSLQIEIDPTEHHEDLILHQITPIIDRMSALDMFKIHGTNTMPIITDPTMNKKLVVPIGSLVVRTDSITDKPRGITSSIIQLRISTTPCMVVNTN